MRRANKYFVKIFECRAGVGAKLAAKEYDCLWHKDNLGVCGVLQRDACQRPRIDVEEKSAKSSLLLPQALLWMREVRIWLPARACRV